MASEVEISVLTASFVAAPGSEQELAATLAKYIVLARHLPHCRNVDLVISTTERGKFLVIQKWEDDASARAHLNSEVMLDMASSAMPLLAERPSIDLWDGISAHDLR